MRQNSQISSIFGRKKKEKGSFQIICCLLGNTCHFAILLHEENETHKRFSRGYFSIPLLENSFPTENLLCKSIDFCHKTYTVFWYIKILISCLQHECLGNGGSRNCSAAHPCCNKSWLDLAICCVLSHRKLLSPQSSSFML